MTTATKKYTPGDPGDMFDFGWDQSAGVISNPGAIECKACATALDTPTQEEMQAHADLPQKLSDGSTGTCREFWTAAQASQEDD